MLLHDLESPQVFAVTASKVARREMKMMVNFMMS